MIRTIIESPFAGNTKKNTEYARAALLDSLRRGEAPIASHLLHTQVLDDGKAEDRLLGMQAGYAWISVAQQMAVYVDRGISDGMRLAVNLALQDGSGQPAVFVRSLRQKFNIRVDYDVWDLICETDKEEGIANILPELRRMVAAELTGLAADQEICGEPLLERARR